MCTLSVIRYGEHGIRLAFNRDELRSRRTALPPRTQRFGSRRAILPIDPQPHGADGTWIAVNDAGVVFALLNVNAVGAPRRPGAISRGRIILRLLDCPSVDAAVARVARVPLDDFAPFRLVVSDVRQLVEFVFDGENAIAVCHPRASFPLMFTSSGLGDAAVAVPRRKLFMAFSPASAEAQDRFHSHRWPARPELSVRMSRDDARTVSYSVIELSTNGARFFYRDEPDGLTFPIQKSLPIQFPYRYDVRPRFHHAAEPAACCC